MGNLHTKLVKSRKRSLVVLVVLWIQVNRRCPLRSFVGKSEVLLGVLARVSCKLNLLRVENVRVLIHKLRRPFQSAPWLSSSRRQIGRNRGIVIKMLFDSWVVRGIISPNFVQIFDANLAWKPYWPRLFESSGILWWWTLLLILRFVSWTLLTLLLTFVENSILIYIERWGNYCLKLRGLFERRHADIFVVHVRKVPSMFLNVHSARLLIV